MTAYRYPDDEANALAVEIERRRRAWHQARTDRDAALRRFYDAVRAEIDAETAFRAVALGEPVTP